MPIHSFPIRHLCAVAVLALAACGGGDDDTSIGTGPGTETPEITPPPVVAIDKTAKPVEFPDTVHPVNYKLWFRPDADLSTFVGRADVEIDVRAATPSIVVAAHKLKFKSGTISLQPGNIPLIATPQTQGDHYQLRAQSGTIPKGRYTLHMEWEGIINQTSYGDPEQGTVGACDDETHPNCSAGEGVFRIDLMGTDGAASGAILTQGESNFSRRWFPGWDEPAFRPTYEVSADVPAAWRVVSNAVEKPAVALPGGYQAVSFEKTPPMPSYLLFFAGGRFDVLEDEFASPLPDDKGMHLRIFTPPGMSERARPAMEATKQSLDYFYRYTGIPLPLAKLDTVAANDKYMEQKQLAFGGMENWGAILEFADDILPQSGAPMSPTGLSILNHEIAHQWFGDLVTLDWWDDIWLNESFASYFATRTSVMYTPEEAVWASLRLNKQMTMSYDRMSVAIPVQPNFNDFGSHAYVAASMAIYYKGQQVLKMLEGFIGDDVMQRGLQQYLRDYAFGNGTPQRLWGALSNASGIDVGQIGDSFVRQTGVPVLSLDTRCDIGTNRTVVMLSQAPLANANPNPGLRWAIPVTLAYGDQLDLRKKVVLSEPRAELLLDGCGPVLANPTGLDYYVTQYSDNARISLQPALEGLKDNKVLRANIESDKRLLARPPESIESVQAGTFAAQAGWSDPSVATPFAGLPAAVAAHRLRIPVIPVIPMKDGRPVSRP